MARIYVFNSAQEMAVTLADWIAIAVNRAAAQHRAFSIAFAGGSTPRRLYEALAHRREIAWEAVYAFWGDERVVPHDHPDSNYRMTTEALLSHVPVPVAHCFPIPTDGDPHNAASRYEQTLLAMFGAAPSVTFDLVLLGMGEDGHTASLFPYGTAAQSGAEWVAEEHVNEVAGWRITLTPSVLNLARRVVVMVTGAGKAARVQEVLRGARDPERLPIQRIAPHTGDIIWVLDRDAAELLLQEPATKG